VTCPSDNEVAAFVAGALHGAEAHAVDVHIDACDLCRALVSEALRDAGSDRSEQLGHLGRYEVLELLGRGGMGVVYRAYDPDLHRHVAIKVFKERAGAELDVRGRERQLREARALARVAHPNVVAVHDVGTVDGAMFMAMELVAGESFDRWRRDAPRSVEQLVEVTRQAGAGLAAAHAAGLVHGDVKPTNLLVTPEERVVVVDFGLSMPPDVAASGGTPGYMAPEQERRGMLDPRTDQYGLCVTLVEALFGDRSLREPGKQAANGEPVPPHVLAVIRRGLARDPAARFANMAELVVALAPPARARRRLALAMGVPAGAVAIAAIAWAAGASSSTSSPPPPQARPPEQPSRAAIPIGLITRSSDMQAWLAFGGIDRAPAPPPAVAAAHVAAYVRARLGSCITADVTGARVAYVLRACPLPRGALDGRLTVVYSAGPGGLAAQLAGTFERPIDGTFALDARATLQLAGAAPRVVQDTNVRGTGVRGIPYRSHWTTTVDRLAGECVQMDGAWTFSVAGAQWVGSFDDVAACGTACPRARRASFASAADAPRIALVFDGTRRVQWSAADGTRGSFEAACDP